MFGLIKRLRFWWRLTRLVRIGALGSPYNDETFDAAVAATLIAEDGANERDEVLVQKLRPIIEGEDVQPFGVLWFLDSRFAVEPAVLKRTRRLVELTIDASEA